jgi:hypothetical protein
MGEFGIGQPVRRFEDKRLLSGNGRFQTVNRDSRFLKLKLEPNWVESHG